MSSKQRDSRRLAKRFTTSMASTEDQGEDRISALPDPLLCSIISFLPGEEAVATGVLSRRWGSLWRQLSCLDIDPTRMTRTCRDRFRRAQRARLIYNNLSPNYEAQDHGLAELVLANTSRISHVISSQTSGNLTACRISHFSTQFSWLLEWIQQLVGRTAGGIRALALTCQSHSFLISLGYDWDEDEFFKLPARVFRCKTLRVLELNNYVIADESPFEGCGNLVTLTLNKVRLTDDTLKKILFNCMFLENLSLRSCGKLSRIEIHRRNLKFLEVKDLSLEAFFLCAKGLSVLVLDNLSCPVAGMVVDCPNLTVFRTYCHPKEEAINIDLLDKHSGLMGFNHGNEHLPKDPQRVPFENLRELCTSLDLNDNRHAVLLSILLRVSTHLCKLEITNQVNANSYQDSNDVSLPSEHEFWDKKELCDSITHHLRMVCIIGFRGKEREIRFVSYLIKNAAMMERLVIQCENDCSRRGANAMMGLLSLPRASINVGIVLRPGQDYVSKVGDDFENWVLTLK